MPRTRSEAIKKVPAKKTSVKLSEQIYQLLKRDIIECVYEPGETLQESAVRDNYRIGHTPFREACARLKAEGLIQIVPHRGYFVAPFSPSLIQDLFELRLMVEPRAAYLACQRQNPVELGRLETNLAESKRLSRGSDSASVPKIVWNSIEFHTGIASMTGNQELGAFVENLHHRLMRLIILIAKRRPPTFGFNAVHYQIFEALRDRNAERAQKLMEEDLNHTRAWIQASV
jgi:DNA-binding GntR family transcriptional regulator